jgi:putative FmdB family regulatory protein
MPIFEYVCRECSKQFEMLVRGDNKVSCPSCDSEELDKQLSVFSPGMPAKAARELPQAACGTCGDPRGPGACSLN